MADICPMNEQAGKTRDPCSAGVSTSPTLRLMRQADYDHVIQLWCDTPGMGLRILDDSPEGIARYLNRNPDTCFVAVDADGHLVGAILCGHDGRRGFIYHTAVAASVQRQGIGRALVKAATDALKHAGIAKVSLVAFAGNEAGNAFWEAQGFAARTDLVYRNLNLVEGNESL